MKIPIIKEKQSLLYTEDELPDIATLKLNISLFYKENNYFELDDLIKKLVMLKFKKIEYLSLTGNIYENLDILSRNVIPELNLLYPVVINLNEYDDNNLSLVTIKTLKSLVNGFILNIPIPLQTTYTEDQKNRYSTVIRRDIYTYRNNILNYISLIDDSKQTIYKTNFNNEILSSEDKDYIVEFSKSLNSDYFFN